MNRKSQWAGVLLVTALATVAAVAQTSAPAPQPKPSGAVVDLAATFSMKRAKVQSSTCSCFWLKGGSIDAAFLLYRGLGMAGNITAEHASGIRPGVNLGKISFLIGPRYTWSLGKKHGTRIFGEWLVGGAHGYDSIFPGQNGTTFGAGSFATQAGIGSDIAIRKGFGLRLFEVDYVHTSLPNNGSNSQNDLRLAFGISYRFVAH